MTEPLLDALREYLLSFTGSAPASQAGAAADSATIEVTFSTPAA